MKILAVRFQNLNSLKGEHEIRFDRSPLSEAGLFAITGPTGAGKTTILDAITVGLYGRAHRHDSDKPLDLMTRHTSESMSEVEFEANGKSYRSKWQIRRSRGKLDGRIQAVHMELCDLEDDKPFDLKPSLVPEKIAEICGLDYNQFLRSVMLSQGDFARFLKASANDRSLLLEKITDTGIYSDISRFAFEKAKQERQKKDELERRLQATDLLPEELRLNYQENIAGQKNKEAALDKEITLLQEKRQWLHQVQQLQERAQVYRLDLRKQEEKLTSLQPDIQKLHRHEQAHQFIGELTQIKAADGNLTEVNSQLLNLQQQLPVLEAQLEQTGKIALETNKAHEQQEEAIRKLEPLLEEVQQLDHQLTTVRDKFATDKESYRLAANALQQEQAILEQKELELSSLTQKATTLKNWLKENSKLKDMREHLHEFRQTIKDLGDVARSAATLQQEQQALSEQIQDEARQLELVNRSIQEQKAQYCAAEEQKQQKVAQLQAVLASSSMDELEKLVQEQPLVLTRYERLLELAVSYGTHQRKSLELTEQLAQLHQRVTRHETELETVQQQHKAASERLEDLQKLVALQQRIQEFEQARHQLQPDQPCPLCGSEHHPFVEGEYSGTLSEDEQRCSQQQVLVKKLDADINTLQLQLNTLQHQQDATAKSKTETDSELQRLQLVYKQQAIGISTEITNSQELEKQLESHRETAGKLNGKLREARDLSREVETINGSLQHLRESQIQAQGQISKLQQSEEMQQKQLQRLSLQLADLQEQQQAFTETAQSFTATYGIVYVAEKRQELLQHLENQAALYLQQHQAYEALRDPFLQLQEQVKSLKEKLREKELELNEKKNTLEQIHIQLTALKEKRTGLFGQKDPQQERQSARQELRNRAQQAEEARAILQKKQQELQEKRQRQQEYTSSHTQKRSELDALREGLLRVLQQKGIETIEVLSQMLLDRDEADRLANQKAQAEKHLTEVRKSLSDVQHELSVVEAKNLTTETTETLQQQLTDKTKEHRNLIEARARLEQLLEQDKQQREKNKELTAQLEIQLQECNRWSRLSDLIGSAEGHKFSKFAQGLTLAKLVQLANRHLQKLNERYRILKSEDDELELYIVDTYQADIIRPMNTLSGGESFLVSLALALGLSDLAGRKTQINSLFIDEGFGTLDADTLDAAISTLENLQESGKMIGIISHVEALKERISSQIKVIKQAGGVSKVEIHCSGYRFQATPLKD